MLCYVHTQRQFPEVFVALGKFNDYMLYADKIWPDADYTNLARLNEVSTWLKQVATARVPLVPLTSETLPIQAVKAIETAATQVSELLTKRGEFFCVLRLVLIDFLLIYCF